MSEDEQTDEARLFGTDRHAADLAQVVGFELQRGEDRIVRVRTLGGDIIKDVVRHFYVFGGHNYFWFEGRCAPLERGNGCSRKCAASSAKRRKARSLR